MGVLRVLDHTGDTTLAWQADDASSLAQAEALFSRLRDEGVMTFARPFGGRAEDAALVRRFDPEAEEIIGVRPIQGG